MNIVLIGMPGAGKSTIGVILAKVLGFQFVDTDLTIQTREKELLQTIINTKGLDAFLDAEQRAVLDISGNNLVIATGGSVVYREDTMAHLKKKGVVIYLNLEYQTIRRRLRNISTRGIAMSTDQTLHELYNERKTLYENYADYKVDCKGLQVEEVVEMIIQLMNELK